jgi:hypothetical protein
MRKYWVLATHWPAGVFPNDELWHIIADKAGDMMLKGELVLGTLGTREAPLGKVKPDGTIAPWLPDWRRSWKKNAEPPTIHSMLEDAHTPNKSLRIFTSEAAALEYADFVLGYGADFAGILSEEEVEAISPLPADEYIQAMIVDPTDTTRINLLQSKVVTLEMMQYFRATGQIPPDAPVM